MKAAVLYEERKPVVVEDVDLRGPEEREVLVRIAASGVCHSDYHRVTGDIPNPLPAILGHEASGVVEEIGPGVTRVSKGDRVVLSWAPFCGDCFYCERDRPAQCIKFWDEGGKGTLFDGRIHLGKGGQPIYHCCFISSFAEYCVVPDTACVAIPQEMPFDKASLLGCAVTTGVGAAINTARVQPGSSVVVIGCGGVGLNVIQGATLSGAERIVAVDLKPSKFDLARQLGATDTIDASEVDVVEAIHELTHGLGADYAFEAIGVAATMEQAYAVTRRGGTVVVVGVGAVGTTMELPANKLAENEKIFTGSYYGGAHPPTFMPYLIDLYLEGKLKLDELMTRTYSLDDTEQALQDLKLDDAGRGVLIMDR
jgi:Zn-dependent alcohol dehydrogenase